MRKFLFSCLSFLFFLTAYSQALNKNTIPRECDEYHLNLKKVKIKIQPYFYVWYDLVDVSVEFNHNIYTKHLFCKNELLVTLPEGDLTNKIAELIYNSYPKGKERKLKIVLKDIKVLENMLPKSNRQMYLSIDFYLADENGNFYLSYSRTAFDEVNNNIENTLGKLIKKLIYEFHSKRQFENNYRSINSDSVSGGFYTSFTDFQNKKITFPLFYSVITEVKNELNSKHFLRDSKNQLVTDPVLAYSYKGKEYISAYYYYKSKHFTELNNLDDEYYFIFDDYDGANSSAGAIATGAVAGGLVGAAIGAAVGGAANASGLPGFIDKKSYRLITFSKSMLKIKLRSHWDEYKAITKEGSREKMIAFFQRLFEEEGFKEMFFKNVVFPPKSD